MRVLPKDPGSRLTIYCDGAARGNPGPAGIGIVAIGQDGSVLARLAQGIGVATNNVAEYRAALEGLILARELGAESITLRSDSKLLIEQLSGRYRVKSPTLVRLHREIMQLLASFRDVRLEHTPRERNVEADSLANQGVDRWLAEGGSGGEAAEGTPELFR